MTVGNTGLLAGRRICWPLMSLAGKLIADRNSLGCLCGQVPVFPVPRRLRQEHGLYSEIRTLLPNKEPNTSQWQKSEPYKSPSEHLIGHLKATVGS